MTTGPVPIASSLEDLGAHFTVVVVGSGYGASVAACRLARAGSPCACWSVDARSSLVTIRTRSSRLAGTRRSAPGRAGSAIRPRCSRSSSARTSACCPGAGSAARRSSTRTSRWRRTRGCSNTGGRAPSVTTSSTVWPTASPGRATMLGVEPLPDDRTPAKLTALGGAASALGHTVQRAPVAVTFADGRNAAGVEQHACTGCGDCVSGCNVGAKNTLLMNYLPDAVRHGARVFTEVDVRQVRRAGDRWEVVRAPARRGAGAVTAPTVSSWSRPTSSCSGPVRSAAPRSCSGRATPGSRCPTRSAPTSPATATCSASRTTGRTRSTASATATGPLPAGSGSVRRSPATSTSRPRSSTTGMVLEDGAIPGAIGVAHALRLRDRGRAPGRRRRRPRDAATRRVRRRRRPLDHVPRDEPRRRRRDDHARRRPAPHRVARRRRCRQRGARHRRADPRRVPASAGSSSRTRNGARITITPWSPCTRSAGAPMAERAEDGVVDERGRVFAGRAGTEVHDGLYVMDAAVMPRSLGVNPLLTITGLAERACALLAATAAGRSARTVPWPRRSGPRRSSRSSSPSGWKGGSHRSPVTPPARSRTRTSPPRPRVSSPGTGPSSSSRSWPTTSSASSMIPTPRRTRSEPSRRRCSTTDRSGSRPASSASSPRTPTSPMCSTCSTGCSSSRSTGAGGASPGSRSSTVAACARCGTTPAPSTWTSTRGPRTPVRSATVACCGSGRGTSCASSARCT